MKHDKQVEILVELLRQIDAKTNVDAGVRYLMPTASYRDPDIAAREREVLFRGHPQLIGLSGDLSEPGAYFTFDDLGVPILAVRGQDGVFRAFLNACRHRGVRVAGAGRGVATRFSCPFHAWTYSNHGELLAIPQESQFGDIDKRCHGLIDLPAEERDGLLWVHPDRNGVLDLDTQLGALGEEIAMGRYGELVYAGESVIDKHLNWKLANDTFGETWHFQKLHAKTLGRLFYGDNLAYETFGRNHRFVFASRMIDQLRDRPKSEWRLKQAANLLYYLFPNVQFNVGLGGNVSLIRIYPHPEDPGRSITRVGHYFTREAMALMEQADANVDVVTPETVYERDPDRPRVASLAAAKEVFISTIEQEDYLMGESTQRSVASGLLPEILFGRNEPALHHFHRTFAEVLQMAGPQRVE